MYSRPSASVTIAPCPSRRRPGVPPTPRTRAPGCSRPPRHQLRASSKQALHRCGSSQRSSQSGALARRGAAPGPGRYQPRRARSRATRLVEAPEARRSGRSASGGPSSWHSVSTRLDSLSSRPGRRVAQPDPDAAVGVADAVVLRRRRRLSASTDVKRSPKCAASAAAIVRSFSSAPPSSLGARGGAAAGRGGRRRRERAGARHRGRRHRERLAARTGRALPPRQPQQSARPPARGRSG